MPDRQTPTFDKAPLELVARFEGALDRVVAPDVTRRKMFGYPCAWINGNMVTGLFANQWWVRLSEPDREVLLAMPGAHQFEVMPGKAMGRYVTMPDDLITDEPALDAWVGKALDFTRSLPPKK
jgi:TfoX/Sxy family transcriptional regulator of competence genes